MVAGSKRVRGFLSLSLALVRAKESDNLEEKTRETLSPILRAGPARCNASPRCSAVEHDIVVTKLPGALRAAFETRPCAFLYKFCTVSKFQDLKKPGSRPKGNGLSSDTNRG